MKGTGTVIIVAGGRKITSEGAVRRRAKQMFQDIRDANSVGGKAKITEDEVLETLAAKYQAGGIDIVPDAEFKKKEESLLDFSQSMQLTEPSWNEKTQPIAVAA